MFFHEMYPFFMRIIIIYKNNMRIFLYEQKNKKTTKVWLQRPPVLILPLQAAVVHDLLLLLLPVPHLEGVRIVEELPAEPLGPVADGGHVCPGRAEGLLLLQDGLHLDLSPGTFGRKEISGGFTVSKSAKCVSKSAKCDFFWKVRTDTVDFIFRP